MSSRRTFFFVAGLALAAGCRAEPSGGRASAVRQAAPVQERVRVLPFGPAPEGLGLVPSGPERRAWGPTALALADHGRALILDPVHHRVVALSPEGSPRSLAQVPAQAVGLAIGAAGAFAVHTPMRRQVEVFSSDGSSLGQVPVSAALPPAVGVSLGASLRVTLHTAFQERFVLGSPRAPLALESSLLGGQQGAATLADGTTVSTLRGPDGAGQLILGRRGARSTHRVAGDVSALRLIDARGSRVVLLAERLVDSQIPGASVQVVRELLVVELAGLDSSAAAVSDARLLLRRRLPADDLYPLVRQAGLAPDGSTLLLGRALAEGLELRWIPLGAAVEPAGGAR